MMNINEENPAETENYNLNHNFKDINSALSELLYSISMEKDVKKRNSMLQCALSFCKSKIIDKELIKDIENALVTSSNVPTIDIISKSFDKNGAATLVYLIKSDNVVYNISQQNLKEVLDRIEEASMRKINANLIKLLSEVLSYLINKGEIPWVKENILEDIL